MGGYLMGYHTETPKGGQNSWNLHLATSEDGLDWMPLNQNGPVLGSGISRKSLCNVFLLRKQDGSFVVLATNSTKWQTVATSDIFVCDTTDFITFENPRLLKLHDTPMRISSPEAFFDSGRNEYGILWAGSTDRHRIYVNHTLDFVNVSPGQVYFDPGQDVRDATLTDAPDQGGHFLYYRDTAACKLSGTRSSTLAPGSFDPDPYANPPGDAMIASPMVVKALHEKRWFLYGDSDSPTNGEFHAWRTDEISSGRWREMSRRHYNPPINAKHPSVVPITRTEMNRLIAHWGRPGWNRLKSLNYPDHVVRHASMLGRISDYPFDPYKDSQWMLVPGLANPEGVSFESVNYPGYYLRSVAEHVMLSKNDGSGNFRTKATFMKVPGLADESWSSFRSLASPDLYLRHANYYLRVDSVSTPVDKEDATFRIVY